MQPPSGAAVGSFLLVFCGYIGVSYALQAYFYQRRRHDPESWKCQPGRFSSSNSDGDSDSQGKGKKGPHHWLFLGCNLLTASLFAALAAEGCVRGWPTSRLVTAPNHPVSLAWEGLLLGAALAWQSVLEYWWHRVMHLRWCYARMHKYHHFYKAPEPFDDMYIHPLEACGYYCILYSPSAVLPMRPLTFFAYMALLGFAGVLDHSGVRVAVPGVYDTRDHDRHHSHVSVNYSFPFPFLDMLHGTYTGECWGRRFVAGRGVVGRVAGGVKDGGGGDSDGGGGGNGGSRRSGVVHHEKGEEKRRRQ